MSHRAAIRTAARAAVCLAIAAPVLLAGCMSLSPYDGKTRFACARSDDVRCQSVATTYRQMQAGELPDQQRERSAGSSEARPGDTLNVTAAPAGGNSMIPVYLGQPPAAGGPLRTPERVLRIWLAPWVDADGDLNDQSYAYVVLQGPRFALSHWHERITREFQAPTPPLSLRPSPAAAGAVPSGPASTANALARGAVEAARELARAATAGAAPAPDSAADGPSTSDQR